MTNLQKLKILGDINFGDIDGLYERNLTDYFVDENYWERLVNGDTFFVLGRKGTGKSAIYNWIESQQSQNGALVSNLSFKQFPFEKLLSLSDDNFSRPNQYQSIWRYIINAELARMITIDQRNSHDDNYNKIESFVHHVFGSNQSDIHKQVTEKTNKTEHGLKKSGILYSQSDAVKMQPITLSDDITILNRNLEDCIQEYLKMHSQNIYVIQFDQLDDNYNSYIDNEKYFQSIVSLFKTVYDINMTYRKQEIPLRVIAYLRSDIFNSIDVFDSESARWDAFKLNLNWSILDRKDWEDSKLSRVINKRITTSIKFKFPYDPFQYVFNQNEIKINRHNQREYHDIFKYIIYRTFYRPRDLIQFCIKIKKEALRMKELTYRTIFNAEREYSQWLLSEVANELSPKLSGMNLKWIYQVLRELGTRPYSYRDFSLKYREHKKRIYNNTNNEHNEEELLDLLYSLGLIFNVNRKHKFTEYFSVMRNERSNVRKDLKMLTHRGFYKGLHVTTG